MTLQTMASLMTLQVSAYSPADTVEIIGELTVTALVLYGFVTFAGNLSSSAKIFRVILISNTDR